MQKKTPLNRQAVLEWFEQPDEVFGETLLNNYSFSFTKLPPKEEI